MPLAHGRGLSLALELAGRQWIRGSELLCRPHSLVRNPVFSLPRSVLCRALSEPLRNLASTPRRNRDRSRYVESARTGSRVEQYKSRVEQYKSKDKLSSTDSNNCRVKKNNRARDIKPDSR